MASNHGRYSLIASVYTSNDILQLKLHYILEVTLFTLKKTEDKRKEKKRE